MNRLYAAILGLLLCAQSRDQLARLRRNRTGAPQTQHNGSPLPDD
jgi:hypothetical protein